LDFWNAYQHTRHAAPEISNDLNASQIDLQAHIRHLYTLADKVLQTQRSHLFPHNLELFLDTNTPIQLQNYIHQYEPAIRLSIRHASRRSQHHTRSLQTYGFTTITPNTTITQDTATTTSTDLTPTNPPVENMPPQPNPRPRLLQRLLTWAHRSSNSSQPTHTNATTPTHINTSPHQTTIPHTAHHSQQSSTTRAPHHKHSRWRPTDIQRQRFLGYFRR